MGRFPTQGRPERPEMLRMPTTSMRVLVPVGQPTVYVLAGLMFALAGANASPAWWSSGVVALILVPLALAGRGASRAVEAAFSPKSAGVTIVFIVIMIVSVLSAAASPTMEAVRSTLFRSVLPFLVYLSFVGIELDRRGVNVILMGLAGGAAVMFARGAIAYVQEWGIPDLQTVMWARFDVKRMKSYQDATVGNVSQMGSYAVLVIAPLVLAGVRWHVSWFMRVVVLGVIALGVANIIFCGARTAIVVLLVIGGVAVVSTGVRRSLLFASIGVGLAIVTAPAWMPFLSDVDIMERFAPSLVAGGIDNSAEERLASILIGIDVFWSNPLFGVGPGNSPDHNIYFIPHMSFVHVASELGIFGVLAFAMLNAIVFFRTLSALWLASVNPAAAYRLIWLVGPSMWLLYGFSGIPFSMSHALLWVGLSHAMLGLSTASIVDLR